MFRSEIIHKVFQLLLLIVTWSGASAQLADNRVDSLMHRYSVPALGYAVITADSLLAMKVYGKTREETGRNIQQNDRFHIGSNTKAITSLIALDLVNKGQLKWESSLYDFFPEFWEITGGRKIILSDLLSFRTPLAPFSYDTPVPGAIIKGTGYNQRYRLSAYLLQQKPVAISDHLYLTNAGYILAGLMLEKASGLSYQTLVANLGKKLQVDFQIGSPNKADHNQTSGHNDKREPIVTENIKLDWLLSSGNLNISLTDYACLIQHFLIALEGKSLLYTREEMMYLLVSQPGFSFGWFNVTGEKNDGPVVQNFGNANGFMSLVNIDLQRRLACIILCNISSPQAAEAIQLIADELKKMSGANNTSKQ